jgi:hypothetical protein
VRRATILAAGLVAGCVLFAGSAGASGVHMTFNGTVIPTLGDDGAPVGFPWGYDGLGNPIAGDPWSASININLSDGTTTQIGGEQEFNSLTPGAGSGVFGVNGNPYAITGAYETTFLRTSGSLEVIIYEEPSAFDGIVIYVPLTNTGTISPNIGASVALTALNPLDVASSGEDSVLPGYNYAEFSSLQVSSFVVVSPEPGTWLMMLAGFGALSAAGLRASRQSARTLA